jgi:two-component system, chemotaxis family, protein-glutamate methylesterase/glutaminase
MTAEPAAHDVVVIGASAGGVEALISLVGALPTDLPAAVFVVLHVAPSATSVLADILDRAGPLPAAQARDGDAIVAGRILVAPPDHHLVLMPGGVLLDHGPKENGHRPGIDPLFRSAATSFGGRVIGVVLSGTRDDGAAGLGVIKATGGVAMVQDPTDALYSSMPRAAIARVTVDAVAPCLGLARLIASTVGAPTDAATAVPSSPDRPAQHAETSDAALWTAVRVLNERAGMLRRLAERTSRGPGSLGHRRFEQAALEAERHARRIREGIMSPAMAEHGEREKTA